MVHQLGLSGHILLLAVLFEDLRIRVYDLGSGSQIRSRDLRL